MPALSVFCLFFSFFAVSSCWSLSVHSLPLPLGEVAEQSEVGEGICALNTCVAGSGIPLFPSQSPYGDSSPRGRAKGLYPLLQKLTYSAYYYNIFLRLPGRR